MSEVDLAVNLLKTKLTFHLYHGLWSKFDFNHFNINDVEFKETKFLNEPGEAMHEDMNALPSNKGGIYFFYIRSGVVVNSDYLVYIGRAWITESQNLKKRCRSYFQTYPGSRAKINRMIKEWGPYLYLRYIELDNNEIITELEKKLINSMLPPFNDEIPDKETKDAVKAFQ